MNNKQARSRSWEVHQRNVANPEDCPFYNTTTSNIPKLDKLPDSEVEQDTKQKVPFTQKYQLHIRKSSQHSPDDIPTPSLPLGAHNGLLQELTFDQGKGQFLWASEIYPGNLKKRRMNGGNSLSPGSLKPYDTKDTKVPRPPNAFIIYHKTKSKELSKFKSKARNDERHPSKTVAEMWKDEPEEIKLHYQREADLALVEHKRKYPYYKYRPKKKDNKNKNNPTSSSIGSTKDSGPGSLKEDSQVPIEHRKQASMESAFTVFNLRTSSDRQEEKAEEAAIFMDSPPETPIWADFPLQLQLPEQQQQQQQQSQCPNCHHPKTWSQFPQISPITTPAATLPLMTQEQALSFEYPQSFASSLATQVLEDSSLTSHSLENSMTSPFPDFPQFNDDISSNNEISIPTIATIAPDVMAFLLTPTSNWNSTEDLAGYVVPSQDTLTSSITLPPDTLQELPPTPTSPVGMFPYTSATATNIQCANQPPSLQQFLQLYTQFQQAHLNNK